MLGNNVYTLNDETYAKSRKVGVSDAKALKILGECKKNIGRWYDFFSLNIRYFRDDKYFFQDTQWTYDEFNRYVEQGKIPFTFNKLKPLVRQLIGEQMNMAPNINLLPKDVENTNPENIIVMTKFLRALAYNSNAAQAYSECFKNQLIGGWGVIQVSTDYEDPYKFDQKIEIKAVPDPLSVGFDPNCQRADKTDGDFQFCYTIMDKDDFKATYPGKNVPTGGQMLGTARDYLPQIDNNSVIVTDYYVKEYKSKTLIQLTNNLNFKVEVLKEDVEEAQAQYMQMMAMQGVDPLLIPPLVESNRRKTKLTFVHCYKCTIDEIIDHYEWPATKFPYVFVDAISMYRDGRQYVESFIHGARDAQKTYNYCMSEAINGLARLKREQVWMTRTQAEGHEEFLRWPDRQQSHGEYNPDPEAPNGPIFRPPEELPQTFFALANQAEEDIYKTLGVYPANRGELPNDTSGVAIGRTITQGNLSFIQLLQNLFNGMQTVGEIILELIPKLYDTERVVSLIDEAGVTSTTVINQVNAANQGKDVTQSVYKLEISPVASFSIQQDMVRQQLYQLASINPEVSPLVLDMIASTIESPIAPRLIERLRTLVPQNILRQEEGLPPLPTPPSPQEQMAQVQMHNEILKGKKMQADIVNDAANLNLKKSELYQRGLQANSQHAIDIADLHLKDAELGNELTKSHIDAHAEIAKAALQEHASALKVLADMHKLHGG